MFKFITNKVFFLKPDFYECASIVHFLPAIQFFYPKYCTQSDYRSLNLSTKTCSHNFLRKSLSVSFSIRSSASVCAQQNLLGYLGFFEIITISSELRNGTFR